MTRCGDMAVRNSTYHKRCIWDPNFGGGGSRGHRSYHSKERCWSSIGSPMWSLRYI